MQAHVYKSRRRPVTYVWLAAQDTSVLPASLGATLGPLEWVLELNLTPERRLPHDDAAHVLDNLAVRGFHLQLPPEAMADPMREDHGTDA